jgi:hypothetical protein
MKSSRISDEALELIIKNAEEIDWGTIRIELTKAGYIDVITEERIRFPIKQLSKPNMELVGKGVIRND